MAQQSPTEGDVQNSSDSQNDESLLDKDNNQSADEQQQDTGSDDNSSDSDSGSSSSNNDKDDQSSDDDGFSKFAKSQGFDPSDLTDRERKALKIAHDNVKAFRTKEQKDELRKATEDINDPKDVRDNEELSDAEKREIQRDMEIAQLRAAQRTRDFYDSNPQAKEYDKEMGQLIKEEQEKHGTAAARYLAQDLERLYILAKARRGNDDSDAAREAGRREERELLRKRQEGSADSSHSTQPNAPKTKVTRDWLASEYDPKNAEHRKMVDEALARGDLY